MQVLFRESCVFFENQNIHQFSRHVSGLEEHLSAFVHFFGILSICIYIYIIFIYISWQKVVWKFMWQSRMCAVLFCVHSGSTRVLYIILNISNSEFYRVSIPLKERISSGLYNYNSTRAWQWKHVMVEKKEDKPLMLSNNLYFQIIRSVFSSLCMVSWFSLCLWCWIIAFFVDQSKDLFQVWYMRTIINSAVWSLCFSP